MLKTRIVLVASVVAGVVSGCDRTGLHARRVDGAVSDVLPRPEVGLPTEVALDPRADARPQDSRVECPLPRTTTTLAELEWPGATTDLVVRGDTLFVGITKSGPDTPPPVSAIVSVSISTGENRTFPLGNVLPSWLAAGNDSLFYVQGKATPTAGKYRYDYTDVARLDLATGQTSLVDSELVASGFSIVSPADNGRGEVFFWSARTSSDDSGALLKRWDQASHSTMTVQQLDQMWSVVADDERLYWSGVNAAGRVAFFSSSAKGGSVTQVQEWSSDLPDPRVLRAVDDQSLYFIRPMSGSKGIYALPKGGGEIRTVAADAEPLAFANKNIDDTHIYWLDISDQTSIKRTLKTGKGGIETIAGDEGDTITDLAVDHCNVYWTPSLSPRVLVRRK